ncbi:TonB-dependent receptor [Chryseotalea sanaruensis]|uniref:TonB-dependent receptor n=1 Tax=Chryseotalea sanaruensis TaxID=2482724 RepID=A0A401UCB8_9BACT|nr:TonB-dependent receptor [Chryseotalea sanaruensis]GCC52520.1 TonB-dependent receptor [Chryseotalea sanaruensis]
MRSSLILLVVAVFPSLCSAQSIDSIRLTKDYDGLLFPAFADTIEGEFAVKFYYNYEWIKDVKIIQRQSNSRLAEVLQKSLVDVRLEPLQLNRKSIVLVNTISASTTTRAQDAIASYSVSGYISDSQSGEKISGATIQMPGTKFATTSSSNGFFTLKLPEGMYEILVNAVGMSGLTKRLRVYADQVVDIEMFESVTELDEIIISGLASKQLSSLDIGLQTISTQSLKSMPPLLGEVDIIRSVLSLPGVTTVGEGASGFNVRGGNVDQNLIVVDNAPLFNSSHLFGLFSVVNSEAISSLSLQKGTLPARYGGRLASVMDISLQDGMDQDLYAEASIGVISSKLKISSPIIKDKMSIVTTGRFAYPSWVLGFVPDQNVSSSKAGFYDATLKAAYRISSKDYLSFSTLFGGDSFRFGSDTTYSWSSRMASLQWLHNFSQDFSSKLSVAYSRGDNVVSGKSFANEFDLKSFIGSTGINYEFFWNKWKQHNIEFGLQSNFYKIGRGDLDPTNESSGIQPFSIPNERGAESSFYFSDAITLTQALSISFGVRLSAFAYLGNGLKRFYQENSPINEASYVETQNVSGNSVQSFFINPEPRFALKFSIDNESSIKLGYNRNFQYLSLLSNTMAVSPIDTWKLSDNFLAPQSNDQASLGYFRNFSNSAYEVSVESYYKIVSSVTQYKEGARLVLNDFIERELLMGKGKSYGVEFYAKKNRGDLTGWISYTYSRSLVLVKGDYEEETLSNGEYFPSNFDKPHDLSLVANYSLTPKFSVSGNFFYSTGRPITYPESIYVVDGYVVADYSEINQSRIPDYHRLDLSFNYKMLAKKNRRFERSWSAGVYNVYARRNPFSVFFKPEYQGSFPQAYKLSVLGTAIPYFAINFKLKP